MLWGRPQTRRARTTQKPALEVLEDRTLLSAPGPQMQTTISQPIIAALEQQAVRMMATAHSELNGIVRIATTVAEEIVREAASLQQQWITLFNDILNPQSPSPSYATPSAGSGSGSGSATTAHNPTNQQPTPVLQQTGNGSGSGASTTAHDGTHSGGSIKPMVSGTGSGSSGSAVVQFGSATATTSEMGSMCGSNSVTLPVDLEESVPYSVSVNYSTSDGSATQGVDYVKTQGIVTFNPGQTVKTITIPILDDGNDEDVGSENFNVTLSNPVHAVLGAVNPCVVNIVEQKQNATDILRWLPCMGDNSSTVQNWYDVTQGFQLQAGALGPNPSSPIQFDNKAGDRPITNAGINWDKSVTVASITFSVYWGQQTIQPGVKIESNGASGTSLSMDGTSDLLVDFSAANSVFQIDNNATITSMNLLGTNGTGSFVIDGGTTKIGLQSAGPPYAYKIGVQFNISSGATLNDEGYSALTFNSNSAAINVQGTMKVGYGTGTGITLIDIQGSTNNVINVGTTGWLQYLGAGGVKDTFNVPVYVQGGLFQLTISGAATQKSNGYLIVKDNSGYKFPNGSLESVYLSGHNPYVVLSYGDTLECDNDYFQTSGVLETTDSSTCALQDGAQKGGTAVINGGSLQVNYQAGNGGFQSSGELDVNGNLNLAGTFGVGIQGDNSGQQGLLKVLGTMTLQKGNSLNVAVNGKLANGTWIIINSGNNIAQFANGPNIAPGLTGTPDKPIKGSYQVTNP